MESRTSFALPPTACPSPTCVLEASDFTDFQRMADYKSPLISHISFLRPEGAKPQPVERKLFWGAGGFSDDEENSCAIVLPRAPQLTDTQILSSGRSLTLSALKGLKGYSEFNPGESLIRFLEQFFYGEQSEYFQIDLSPPQIALAKSLLLQRVPRNHNKWLVQTITSMNETNYKKVCASITDHIKLHRTNIAGHLVFSKLVAFSRERPGLELLAAVEMPKNQIFSVEFFKKVFSTPGFKEQFEATCKSAEFKQFVLETSRRNFQRVIKSVLYAAKLTEEDPSVKITQKVNLGLAKGQLDQIHLPFKRYLS